MRILYVIYQLCIALPLFLIATIITALTIIVGTMLGNAHFWSYYPGMVWGRITCALLLLPVRVEGRGHVDKHTSYVFVANHQGAFDIFLIYGYLGRNFKWMMKKSLRRLPFVGKACQSAGHIFVDRSGPEKIKDTIDKAKASLVDGVSLVVFPEGSRTFTGHMGYFKRGAFQIASDLQLPVVPVTINGSFNVLSRTARLVSWHPLTLTIHPPIPAESVVGHLKETSQQAYSQIESRLPDQYKGSVRNPDQDIP